MIEFQGLHVAYPHAPESEETTNVVDTLSLHRLTTYSGSQRFRLSFGLETVHETDARIGALRAHLAAHGVRDRFLGPIPQSHVPVRMGTSTPLTDADIKVAATGALGARSVMVQSPAHAISFPAGAWVSFMGLGTAAAPSPRKLHLVTEAAEAARGKAAELAIFPGLVLALATGNVVNVARNWWRYAEMDGLSVPTDDAGMARPVLEWIEG